jgi:hypothetical protein
MRAVDPAAKPALRRLVGFLRELKTQTQLTYQQMAARTAGTARHCGRSTLTEVVSGARLPRWEAVHAYAWACGDPSPRARQARVDRAYALWRAAAREAAPAAGPAERRKIRTTGQLGQHLHRLWKQSGISLRLLETATAQAGLRVPRSTIQLIMHGRILPADRQLLVLLTALESTPEQNARLRAARDRIADARQGDRQQPPVPAAAYLCLDGHPAVESRQEQLRTDERIKRRTGQLRDDEDYDDWRSDRTYGGARDVWDLSDEEIKEMERQSAQAAARAGHDPGQLRAALLDIAARAAQQDS